MSKPIDSEAQLGPVVARAVKAFYGDMQDVHIVKVDRLPLFHQPKEGWMVHVKFHDNTHSYSVQIDVRMADGSITRSVELGRRPLGA